MNHRGDPARTWRPRGLVSRFAQPPPLLPRGQRAGEALLVGFVAEGSGPTTEAALRESRVKARPRHWPAPCAE